MNYLELNRKAWDKRTAIHVDSQFYDVAGFIRGKSSLNSIELEQVGDVNGKTLLHLQCHFGLDSLSWSRLGANVTGVDLSPIAIDHARDLPRQLGLKAEFIADDIYHFGSDNTRKFNNVFTSYGVLCWLPDLTRWAAVI